MFLTSVVMLAGGGDERITGRVSTGVDVMD